MSQFLRECTKEKPSGTICLSEPPHSTESTQERGLKKDKEGQDFSTSVMMDMTKSMPTRM